MKNKLILLTFLFVSCNQEQLALKDVECRKKIYSLSERYMKEATPQKFRTAKVVCYDKSIDDCAVLATETETTPEGKQETWLHLNFKTNEILHSGKRLITASGSTVAQGEKIQEEVIQNMECVDF